MAGEVEGWDQLGIYKIKARFQQVSPSVESVTGSTVTSPELESRLGELQSRAEPAEVDQFDPSYFCMTKQYKAGGGVHPGKPTA